MKKYVLISLMAFLSNGLMAQTVDSISLDACQRLARENYPLIRQSGLLKEASDLRLNNLNKNWYPQLYLNAQASYQTDVTQIQLSLPGIQMPEMNKDMYKVTLDVNQSLYDGSQTAAQKSIERATLKSDLQNTEVELNKLRERINQLYFSILLAQENEKLLLNIQDELKSKLKKAESAVRNDAMLQQQADVLQAELLKSDQQLIEVRNSKETSIRILARYTAQNYSSSVGFKTPAFLNVAAGLQNKRAEMSLFDAQIERLDATKKLTTARLLPRISLFAQAGYGRPGLNMLDPDFSPWGMGGVKISWNIWNWGLSGNERKVIDLQKNLLVTQKETFDLGVQTSMQRDFGDISKYNELIAKDKEIIALRTKIVSTLSVQLDNGLITATEYTTELNAVAAARLNMQLHLTQQYMAIYNYMYNSGN
jgi:outer membrane protein TolC